MLAVWLALWEALWLALWPALAPSFGPLWTPADVAEVIPSIACDVWWTILALETCASGGMRGQRRDSRHHCGW